MHTTRTLLFLLLSVLACAAQRGMRSPAFVSSVTDAAPAASAPDAPYGPAVTYGPAPNWTVVWIQDVPPTGFEYAYSLDGGSFTVVGGIGPGAADFITTQSYNPGHYYSYKVRATNAVGASAYSSTVTTATAAPDAPTIDSLSQGGSWEINITSGADAGDGIEARVSTDGGATFIVGGLAAPAPLDSGIVSPVGGPGDTHSYRYELRATNAFGQSAWTPAVYTVWTYLTEYYRMEEAAGSSRTAFVDTDGFGSFVEQVGNVTQTTGKNNNAAAFTSAAGRSFKSTSASGDTRFSGDFSIACYVYCTALPIIIDTTIIIREAVSDVKLNLTAAGDLTWTSVDGDGVSTASLGSLNAWHLVVCTFTGAGDSTPRISVDGSAFDASAGATTVISGDDFLYICPPFGGLLSLNGRVDEFCVFSFALAQADVTVLYNAGTGLFR